MLNRAMSKERAELSLLNTALKSLAGRVSSLLRRDPGCQSVVRGRMPETRAERAKSTCRHLPQAG